MAEQGSRATRYIDQNRVRKVRLTTVPDDPASGDLLAQQPYKQVPVTSGPGLRHLPVKHPSEVLFGREFQAPNHDHAPARLEKLVGLIDLEGTHGVKCMVVNLAVGNRTKDDGVLGDDVVERQYSGTVINDVREPAHGLAASSSRHSWRSSFMSAVPSSAAVQNASRVVCAAAAESDVGCSDAGMAEPFSDELC